MRSNHGGRLALLAVALVVSAGRAPAADPPHWSSASIPQTAISCTRGCHETHQATGGTLTLYAGNVALCQSCHVAGGLASALPLNKADAAVPGQSGSSHNFAMPAVNPSYGAQAPLDTQMTLRVMSGMVVCSTCHNPHSATSAKGGDPRIGTPKKITALGSTGTVGASGTFAGATGFWYLLEIQTPGASGAATFRWSKDSGTSWMASNVATGAGVALDNGVTVGFGAGNYVSGERWEFAASWPFLRVAADSGDNAAGTKLCRDCHRAWAMDHNAVEVWDGTRKSHPVGVALNVNGSGYDRATPLDANGAVQGSAGRDTNAGNDLKLDGTSRVQCLTCHAPHFAPSNSTAVIP